MDSVRAILEVKGSAVFSVAPELPVIDALRVMAEHNVGALIVVADGEIKGIFSERDYARKVSLRGRSAGTTSVKDVMTSDLFTVTTEHSVEACMALMTAKHIRHLPVVESGRLLGMISIGDVVKSLIAEREQTIQQLTNYITGSRT